MSCKETKNPCLDKQKSDFYYDFSRFHETLFSFITETVDSFAKCMLNQ